jgi:hypothetical protein
MDCIEPIRLRVRAAKTNDPVKEALGRLEKLWDASCIGIREGEVRLADNSKIPVLSEKGKVKLLPESCDLNGVAGLYNPAEMPVTVIKPAFPAVLLFEQVGFSGRMLYSEVGRFSCLGEYIGVLEILNLPLSQDTDRRRIREMNIRMLECLTQEFIIMAPFGPVNEESLYFRNYLPDSITNAMLGECRMAFDTSERMEAVLAE